MPDQLIPPVSELSRPEDFLSPEQRWNAIAEILATITLRALKQNHETETPTLQ